MNIYIFDFLLREFTTDTLHAAPFVNQSSIGNSFSSWADEVLQLLLLPLILLQNKIILQTEPHLSLFLTLWPARHKKTELQRSIFKKYFN